MQRPTLIDSGSTGFGEVISPRPRIKHVLKTMKLNTKVKLEGPFGDLRWNPPSGKIVAPIWISNE